MSAAVVPRTRAPLRRPRQGRALAGVCAGVAEHLGVPVALVRWSFALTALAVGAGALMYLWLWVTVPDQGADAGYGTRLAPRLRAAAGRVPAGDIVLAVVLLVLAGILLLGRVDLSPTAWWVLPVLVVAAGAALVWGQVADAGRTTRGRGAALVRVVAGVGIAALGALLLVGRGDSPAVLLQGAAAGLAIVAGVGVVLAPLLLRLVNDLGREREARAREAERADIAAHLHDSVLQTLAVIRSRAEDPAEVARLARAQERELRTWLYADRPEAGTSVAADIRRVAAEVEDQRAVPVEVVTAGDGPPDAATAALAAATREALTNAVVHGRPPVTLYAEIRDDATEVFVRDRGDGFDVADVPEDRHGVRESIIARTERHGGRADVRTRADGTEIHLTMPRKESS